MHESLLRILTDIPQPVIAVSGGVDSVSLAGAAASMMADVALIHAVSPAVPAEATDRLRRLANERGWRLKIIEAGEFADPNYRENPANRCYFCKSNLYGAIRRRTNRQILSGANLDDLGEYRPGLLAAKRHDVRHPYVEAGMGKSAVRAMARELGLHEVADLPSSPCLSSRIETGIRIESSQLQFVHRVEQTVASAIKPRTIRCRIRAAAVVLELDPDCLARLSATDKSDIVTMARAQPGVPADLPILFEAYRNGSAFLHQAAP